MAVSTFVFALVFCLLCMFFHDNVRYSMLILSKKPYLRSIKIINGNIYFKKEKRYMKKQLLYSLAALTLAACSAEKQEPIDRRALVERNNPQVAAMDSLSSLSVGNGEFAYTVDATGLQTFPEVYKNGVPLGTQSQWGWHSFANTGNYKPEDAQKEYDFGAGTRRCMRASSRKKAVRKTLPTGFASIRTACIWALWAWSWTSRLRPAR